MKRLKPSALKGIGIGIGFGVLVIGLILWLAGTFSPKIPADAGRSAGPAAGPTARRTVAAEMIRLPMQESAIGSIRAVHEAAISSRLAARVVEVKLKAGQQIAKGDVLIRLDDSDLTARIKQAQANVESAKATRANAETDFKRVQQMRESNVASKTEFDKAETALKTAEADLNRVEQAVAEAQSMLEYATVKSPIDGVIVDKKVDVGDTVMPGQIMATAYDPRGMQLIASVRESLVHRLTPGQMIGVQVEQLGKMCQGQVSEIVPEAQSASRTFQVKVTGPCPPGIYSGMFGRIIIPLGEEDVLVIPAGAIQRIGQLEQVEVAVDGRIQRRAIRTGRDLGGRYEVLSGLKAGERVVVPESSTTRGA